MDEYRWEQLIEEIIATVKAYAAAKGEHEKVTEMNRLHTFLDAVRAEGTYCSSKKVLGELKVICERLEKASPEFIAD